jgi:hypothetical protein
VNEQEKDRLRARVAADLELPGPEKVHLVVLPAMGVHMEAVTSARKAQLASTMEAALEERIDRRKVPKTRSSLDDVSILEVCRTCRGACCQWGETHAYLTRAVLERVKSERRVRSDAALLESYLDRVPEMSRRGSCIYHGPEGCALPREMRSETCNRFICYPLKQLGRDFSNAGYAQLAVSTDAERGDRVLLLADGETRALRFDEAKTVST